MLRKNNKNSGENSGRCCYENKIVVESGNHNKNGAYSEKPYE
jgi:hypothetical protein